MTASLPGEVSPIASPPPLSASLERLHDLARGLADRSRATSTRASYESSWRAFQGWANSHGLASLPADPVSVSLYAAHLVSLGRSSATVERAVVAISQVHIDRGHPTPRANAHVRRVLRGVARLSSPHAGRKAALMRDDMTKMIAGVGSGLVGARDAALIALGWGSGLRRSELVALNVEDVTFTSEGLTLHVRRAKTDQAGVGRRLGVAAGVDVATDPVRLMRAWLEHAELTTGPLFRGLRRGNRLRDDRMSTKAVALIVQRLAKGVGLDPRRFAAHSLRRGHATTAALDGIPDRVIARRLGHRSLAMTARYIRETQVD